VATVDRERAATVLGVATTATPEQVREAFRRRARHVHPDAVGGDAASMIELNEAYRILSLHRGTDWEFAEPSEPEIPSSWIAPPLDVSLESPGSAQPLLRFLWIALIVVGAISTAVVFVAAIGYDWSLSP
jgi:hypothetical protein